MNYKKINLYLGWSVFLIATIIFFITIEDTVSLWDCGEYILAANKLEVGHPPGAPFFMVLGRLFTFFADPENVAVWINRLSALSSSGTILFMFWSITMLIKKIALKGKSGAEGLSKGDKIAIFGSAIIGSFAYTFTDSFWFSATEGEVYAMSSLFTAIIFWAILKWDEEMMEVQGGNIPQGYSPDRWLLLIMFMLGLAIGVHLLGILVIPAIAYIIYFRYKQKADLKGIILVGILAVAVLGFIQSGIIQGSISLASAFEVGFVKSLGMPFYSGTIFFFILLIAGCVVLIRYARRKKNHIVYSATMGLILLLIGYGSFAIIVIRSNANTPMDQNNPENLVTLHSYLKRDQYGSAPILFGPHWNSKEAGGKFNSDGVWDGNADRSSWGDLNAFHLRRFVVQKGDVVVKAFKEEASANEFAKDIPGAEVKEDYYESNAATRKNMVAKYSQSAFFPRMYWNQDQRRIDKYASWSGYDATDGSGSEIGKDGKRLPTFGENIKFFKDYQVNWMYWRYFMWNFSGRQNDIQGHGSHIRGNWLSGYSAIDNARLGDQGENAPYFTSDNNSNNRFYFLPLILGFIGLIFHFYRSPKDGFVLLLAFLFTGLAITIYLNPRPFEPRERDYAFAGSFFFFAMWIGIGAYALYDAFKSFKEKEFGGIAIVGGVGLVLALILDIGSDVSMPTLISWLIIFGIGGGVLGLMAALRKALKSDVQGAIVAFVLCLFVPVIMGVQGWDDHDRSEKTTAHDVAYNYLASCEKNGILFTNGDNDTFPLWYMQEVEGVGTDVRVCNLSLMQTDWYTNQMKMKAYDSDPLPIKFTEDQILMNSGNTDQVYFINLIDLFYMGAKPELIKQVIKLRAEGSPNELRQAANILGSNASSMLASASAKEARAAGRLQEIKVSFGTPLDTKNTVEDIYQKYRDGMELLSGYQNGLIEMPQETIQNFQKLLVDFETNWNYSNLTNAMEFTRNDDNLVTSQGQRLIRIFPSTGFVLPVNKDNAVKSGLITAAQKKDCLDQLKFNFTERGLTREQAMMLDILGNNNWERSISFSSPGGSKVSIALYGAGYVKQNGMVFDLSPLNNRDDRFVYDKMYDNLMKNYHFGAMDNPDVLTDYYARRHTSQYRLHFKLLAEDYALKALQGEDDNTRIAQGEVRDPKTGRFLVKVSAKDITKFKTRAKNLIHRSLEVMPAELVIDYGEPTALSARENYEVDGRSMTAFSGGVLHDYVATLLMVGDKKGAEELGEVVASQLESIINYYENSDVRIATNGGNTKDLYAALGAYFKLFAAANDEDLGNPAGALAKRTKTKVSYMYSTMFPTMIGQLKQYASDYGETGVRGSDGVYTKMMFALDDNTQAISLRYRAPAPVLPEGAAAEKALQELLKQKPIGDSVVQ
jgi:Protein O-mannosyl-transferase TMEM260-like